MDPKLLLNSALRKIYQEKEIDAVKDAEEVIRNFGSQADYIQQFRSGRQDSKLYSDLFEQTDLQSVGSYQVTRMTKGNKKIIVFYHPDGYNIEFTFVKDNPEEYFERKIKRLGELEEEEALEVVNITVSGIIGGKSNLNSKFEKTLGKDSRSLDTFVLNKVDIKSPKTIDLGFFKIPLRPNTHTVYPSHLRVNL